jgi:hypothetical protein
MQSQNNNDATRIAAQGAVDSARNGEYATPATRQPTHL